MITLTKHDTRTIALFTWVYCIVHGAEGWTRIIDVRQRDGYIKISSERVWCQPFNFSLTDRNNKRYEELS